VRPDFVTRKSALSSDMKRTTASSDPKAFAKLKELVKDIDIAMVTTVTVEGGLRSRPMATRQFEDDGVLWFFTSEESGMAEDLHDEHAVNVSYAEPKDHRYVSVTGNAAIVHDRERAKHLWAPMLKTYFPRGLDDPHIALLCVRIEMAEYWDASSSKMVRIWETTKNAVMGEAGEMGENVKVDIRNARASG
jgi:general stress protein 26